jgi:hypothetical protein
MEPRNEIRKHYRINAETYKKLGGAMIAEKGGFVLGLEEGECQGVKIPQTPRQWGAWRAYFKERGIPTTFMDAKAKATATNTLTVNPHCWTVPTEWPHEFDSEATVQGDHEAGNWFMWSWRPPNPVMADAARREITAASYRKWARENLAKDALPDQSQTPELKYNDLDELLANYEKDMAAARQRDKRMGSQ